MALDPNPFGTEGLLDGEPPPGAPAPPSPPAQGEPACRGLSEGGSPPPAVPPLPADRSAPLREEDFLLVRQAALRRRPIQGAARTAHTSAIVMLAIGVSAVPLSLLWPSWDGILTAAALCAVGVLEYEGFRRMRRADPAAARFLGRNQLALLGIIIAYSVIQMVTFSPKQVKEAAISPEARSQLAALPEMQKAIDAEIDRYAPLATYGFYGLVIFLSLLCQGGLAMYYFTRRRHLEAFHSQTPPWVQRLFIETAA